MIRVVVSGAGQMGALVLETVEAQDDLQPVGIIEPLSAVGPDHALDDERIYPMLGDPDVLFQTVRPDVVVDFTSAEFTPRLITAALAHGVRPVIGTSGVTEDTLQALRDGCAERGLGAVYAPNFAIGAVIQMHMARIAARFFDSAEIIELHHDRKVDAPSGTALATARLMREARGSDFAANTPDLEHLEHARGARLGGVPIHSVRLPGFVASQEVIFGGYGQTLSLRHDSTGRDSFMPGVLLAVREVMRRNECIVGLDALIGLS